MKLYDFGPAASAQRVRVFLAEKGLDLPTEQLNVREGAQYTPALTEMNPFHCVPFLELDDGTIIAESLSICRYLEELYPTPALFGRTSTERAVIDMWLRRFELDGLVPMLHAVRNSMPAFAGRVVPGTRNGLPQLPELVTRGREMLEIFLGRVEPHMTKNVFVAGSEFSVADITGFFALRSANTLKMDVETRYPAIAAWFAKISARPSFQL
ncbi:glutathione S-transferase family protein [Bradyrhizobium jicamae]|uniref:glutathione S-transferase family protein n=1 Tax=Bradyrhizobium jicamae TaxID=280332 RepID=UPI001BAAAB35|nr:glutathione S-transferase family protein [Bradyrhizobium jicamae]MBR0751137.1 glutathione S-transferase family protein [Bradyrhizobium jicamae]